MKMIRWSQWSPNEGIIRCGEKDLQTLMKWMTDLGEDAHRCLKSSDKAHAIYGRKIYDGEEISEIRFYVDTYVDDDELDDLSRKHKNDMLYVAHKHE